MLGTNILLAMAKDTNGLRPIIVGFNLLITPLSFKFRGSFQEHISLY